MNDTLLCCGEKPIFNDNSLTRYVSSRQFTYHTEPVYCCLKCLSYYSGDEDHNKLRLSYVKKMGIEMWFTPSTLKKLADFRRLVYIEGMFAADAYQVVMKNNDIPTPIYYFDDRHLLVWRDNQWAKTELNQYDLPPSDHMEYTMFTTEYIQHFRFSLNLADPTLFINEQQAKTLLNYKLVTQDEYDHYLRLIS